ncbi:MAG: DnaB-like helicase C-terminal domain-containing protein [Pseudomonadota bacterium]
MDVAPPHNLEAEHALLGSLLVANDQLQRVERILEPEHFYDPVHGRIYDVTAKLIRKKALASPATVKSFMAQDEGLTHLGGGDYLKQLAANVVSLRAVEDYAKTIKELAIRRDLIEAANEIVADASKFDPDRSLDEIAEQAETAVQRVMGSLTATSRPSVVSFYDAAASAVRRAVEAMEKGPGTPTGWPSLNRLMGGLMDGDLTVIAGRPGMGKSAVAISLARHVMTTGRHVIYATLEMPPDDVVLRVASEQMARFHRRTVPFRRLRIGEASHDDLKFMANVISEDFAEAPMAFCDMHVRKIGRLEAEVRRQVTKARKAGGEVGAVIMDYIGLIEPENPRATRYETITKTTAALKALAGELKVPVVALSQLSRQVESREDKRPMLSDLRESGSVEQDADNVIFVYREDYYLRRSEPPQNDPKWMDWQASLADCDGLLELIVSKQRNGSEGSVKLRYEPSTNSIWDLEARR